jgi:hypothetical protein
VVLAPGISSPAGWAAGARPPRLGGRDIRGEPQLACGRRGRLGGNLGG